MTQFVHATDLERHVHCYLQTSVYKSCNLSSIDVVGPYPATDCTYGYFTIGFWGKFKVYPCHIYLIQALVLPLFGIEKEISSRSNLVPDLEPLLALKTKVHMT